MKKRGISPLISVILVITLTIIIAVVALTWGLDTVQKYKEKSQSESDVALKCSDTGFKISEACILADYVNIVLENTGKENINGFLYRVKSEEGISTYDSSHGLNQYSKKTFIDAEFDTTSLGVPEEVEIFPKIIVNEEEFICSYSNSESIKNCFDLLNFEESDVFISSDPNNKNPFIGIISKDELEEKISEFGFVLLHSLALSDYILASGGTQGYVLSDTFIIPDDPKITHIGVYGETNNNVIYSLVEEGNPTNTLLIYQGDENIISAFEFRKSISNWEGKTARLKIDYAPTGGNPAYALLYRFCYTDSHSGCII